MDFRFARGKAQRIEEVAQFFSVLRTEITSMPRATLEVQTTLEYIGSARRKAELMNAAIEAAKGKSSVEETEGLRLAPDPVGLPGAVISGQDAVRDIYAATDLAERLRARLAGIRELDAEEIGKAVEALRLYAADLMNTVARWRFIQELVEPIARAPPHKITDMGLRPAIFKEVERDATVLPFDPSKRRRTEKN